MLNDWLLVILTTLIPGLELRASIPLGVFNELPVIGVFVVAVITNMILGFAVWFVLKFALSWLNKISFLGKFWSRYLSRLERKAGKYVHKYGKWALALFIAVPLPLSGVYSGALAAHILGFKSKEFVIPNIIGVIIAGTIVTLLTVLGFGSSHLLLR